CATRPHCLHLGPKLGEGWGRMVVKRLRLVAALTIPWPRAIAPYRVACYRVAKTVAVPDRLLLFLLLDWRGVVFTLGLDRSHTIGGHVSGAPDIPATVAQVRAVGWISPHSFMPPIGIGSGF